MTETRTCPNCQRRLYFAPDGRSLICERCGYKETQQNQSERPDVDELIRSTKWMTASANASPVRARSVRDLLVRGVAAAKNGDEEEAFYYLERVLLTESSDEERAKAWLWLSGLYDEPVQRRKCLEQVLAHQPQNMLARRGMAVLDGRLNPDDIIDPDKLEVAEVEPQTADVEQFTCPRCNGRLHYTPNHDALACEFCDYRQALGGEQVKAQYGMGEFEQDFIAAMHTKKGHLSPVQMPSFQCQSCAVEFLLAPETISVTCPYCDSVYVTETAEARELLPPQALLPFAVSLEMAEKSLRAWFKQHTISRPRVSPIIGMYLPMWTFDIGGVIKWNGMVQRGYGNNQEWVPVKGEKVIFYDDVLALATHKLPDKLSLKVLPSYDLGQLVQYDARYLADWPAERYQIALGDAAIQARKQVLTDLRRHPFNLTGESGYIKDLRTNTHEMIVESFKQVLLPLWVVHYKFEEQVYDVLLNGQTAEIFGERPQGIVGRLFGWLSGNT
ncbi:MAG: hypothetical protein H6658_18525 [Ardenticatenaceae bacterium]|nr:hypothetical protein [Ardenticatenaceae bacterium]